MIGGIELERPLVLVLLALPVALVLLVRLRARPAMDATGTLEIWRRAAADAPTSAARSRRRVPLAIWLLCTSLACATFAAAGPRTPSAPRTLHVIFDDSPSMYLADGGVTRLERAWERARSWLEGEHFAEIEWESALPHGFFGNRAFRQPESAQGPLPLSMKTAPATPGDEPDWTLVDRADHLWITDRRPEPEPKQAGFSCSGGAAVFGPVGVSEGRIVDWDGTRLVATDRPAPRAGVQLSASGELARVAHAWADANGYEIGPRPQAAIVLRIGAGPDPGAGARTLTVGRDGWSARARVGAGNFPPDWVPWLTGADERDVLVAWKPGRIDADLFDMEDVTGDPAAFAVSWARLFDECALPPPGCVALSERQAAGEPSFRAPRPADSAWQPAGRWAGVAAVTAFGLCLLAWLIPGSSRRPARSREHAPLHRVAEP